MNKMDVMKNMDEEILVVCADGNYLREVPFPQTNSIEKEFLMDEETIRNIEASIQQRTEECIKYFTQMNGPADYPTDMRSLFKNNKEAFLKFLRKSSTCAK